MEVNDIRTVVVIGAGTMGEGIVQNFAQAGLNVRVVARKTQTLENCLKQVSVNLKTFQEYELLDEAPEAILKRIQAIPADQLSKAIDGCDYVVETIPENADAKKETFEKLDGLPENVVVASNTGSFPMDNLTEGIKTPQRFIGTHYFNPAHIIPAVEVHLGSKTTNEAFELTKGLLLKAGKNPVLVRKVKPGFIVNRITGAIEREIDYLLDEGIVTPEDLDIAIKSSIGFRFACLGPMEVEDMIGLDIAKIVSGRVFKLLSNTTEPSPELVKKVEKGELGIKAGKGWYDYSGKDRSEVLENNNRKLLRQLKLFKSK